MSSFLEVLSRELNVSPEVLSITFINSVLKCYPSVTGHQCSYYFKSGKNKDKRCPKKASGVENELYLCSTHGKKTTPIVHDNRKSGSCEYKFKVKEKRGMNCGKLGKIGDDGIALCSGHRTALSKETSSKRLNFGIDPNIPTIEVGELKNKMIEGTTFFLEN